MIPVTTFTVEKVPATDGLETSWTAEDPIPAMCINEALLNIHICCLLTSHNHQSPLFSNYLASLLDALSYYLIIISDYLIVLISINHYQWTMINHCHSDDQYISILVNHYNYISIRNHHELFYIAVFDSWRVTGECCRSSGLGGYPQRYQFEGWINKQYQTLDFKKDLYWFKIYYRWQWLISTIEK